MPCCAVRQVARVTVADNQMRGMGREYKGAPAARRHHQPTPPAARAHMFGPCQTAPTSRAQGVHSFCMRDSAIEHNAIDGVSYTGISYNWPHPQA